MKRRYAVVTWHTRDGLGACTCDPEDVADFVRLLVPGKVLSVGVVDLEPEAFDALEELPWPPR